MFGFEKLDVYRQALEFVVIAANIVASLPTGQGALADQLKRASMSIALNLAESSGRMHRADACRHVAIARGSAMECAAIIDICGVLGLADKEQLEHGRATLVRIVQMLSKMR